MLKSESGKECRKGGCGCTCEKRPRRPGRDYRREDYDGCWAGIEEEE
jgi:hypothetical protein